MPDTAPEPEQDLHTRFQPDYTPEQLESLGVYDSLYRGAAPRLASLGEWKPEWISEHDPKGWAQWYKRYASGRRLPGEDERQIKRWLSFKSRHGGPFAKNPTARRGWALRNWAVDPAKLVPEQAQEINTMLEERQRKAMQKFVQERVQAEKAAELSPDVELQEHQQRIADRVSGDDPRLLVYHGLGSGKSLSAIAAAETARRNSGGQYGIVVPASLRGNFQKELAKFAPGSSPEILSYSGMALGKKFQSPPETLVMDEAQRLRNPESAASRAAREAAQQAKRLVLLSGTPITNSPSDMANLISMLTNKEITPKQFEERYIGYKSKFPGIIPYLRGAQWGEVPYVKNEKELRKLLEGRVDYHPSKTPEGVDVQEEVVKTPLTKAQQKIQKAIRTKVPPGFLWKLDKEFPMSREELAKMNSFLNGLRQVSLSTQSFRGDRDPLKAFDQSGKLQTAMQNLQKALESDERKKALIYSNFVESGVNPYAAALDRAKIPYGIFHGGISPEARQKALRDYNEGKLRALLIGPAGAEGISTKGTNLIQLLDPHWNEARIQQARGRGLRFDSHAGLPEDLKNVQVQRYLSSSEEPGFVGKLLGKRRQRTGDEVIESLASNKEQLNEAFRKILREIGTPPKRQAEQEETAQPV
jgi:superfamily II DNA or RNA helicase